MYPKPCTWTGSGPPSPTPLPWSPYPSAQNPLVGFAQTLPVLSLPQWGSSRQYRDDHDPGRILWLSRRTGAIFMDHGLLTMRSPWINIQVYKLTLRICLFPKSFIKPLTFKMSSPSFEHARLSWDSPSSSSVVLTMHWASQCHHWSPDWGPDADLNYTRCNTPTSRWNPHRPWWTDTSLRPVGDVWRWTEIIRLRSWILYLFDF